MNRSPNMFTLIAIGTGTAYLYSAVRNVVSVVVSRDLSARAWSGAGLFRSRGRDHDAGAARSGVGTPSEKSHQRRHQSTAGTGAEDGATVADEGSEEDVPLDAGASRRSSAGSARRENAGRRHGPRRDDSSWTSRW